MAVNDKHENAHENFELGEDLEKDLKGAYEAMGPTAEQEKRMLSAIKAAQQAAEEPAEVAEPATQPQEKRARRTKPWIIALPLAACLAVGAVLVGVSTTSMSPTESIPDSGKAEVAQSTQSPYSAQSNAPSSAGTEESAVEVEPLDGEVEMYEMAVDEATYAGGAYAGAESRAMAETDVYWPDDIEDDIDFNTEEYDSIQERGFTSTKTSPLSTVSADVDTASYCNVRRMINDGTSLGNIPAGAVRIEEMLNYFHYDYASPTGDDLFSMQAQASACPWNKETQLLVMGFATQKETGVADKGSNLVFLIDVSGSMDSPDKLDLLQDSFATLTEHLDGNDRVSIVTYASGEDIVLEGAAGDDDRAIMRAIYKLNANGSTNGEAGLKQAYEVAERNFIEGGVNRIIMASDGDLNVGISSESDLHDYVDSKRESGIYLSVLGFGSGNYKDNKMETLADHGNGSYHYIDCIEEAERVLSENLMANLVPFADDVKIQVEFNPAQVKAYRLIGYDNRILAAEDFRNDEVDAGDVGPNSQFTVAYEVVPVDSAFKIDEPELKYGSKDVSYQSDSGDWLTCTMRYHVFDGDTMREQSLEVKPDVSTASPSDDWRFAAAVIEFGMLARDSKYAGDSSIDAILGLLPTDLSDPQRAEFRKLAAKAS